MKIINSKIFQVIYYYYYLLLCDDFKALGMIVWFFWILISGVLMVIGALIYSYWIGLILAFLIYLYVDHVIYKSVYYTGLYKKIIKKKPKILNSHFLSILFSILYIAFCVLIPIACARLSLKINDMGISLIK